MINLLLNVLIILVCVFLLSYLFLQFPQVNKKYRQFIIASISMVGIALCMFFPYYDLDGAIYDLRIIPFLLAALYGGREVAASLFTGLLLVRFYIGFDPGFFVSAVHAFLLLLFTYHFSSLFLKSKLSNQLLITLSLVFLMALLNYSIFFIFYFERLNYSLIISALNHFTILSLTLILVLNIIEYIKRDLKFKEKINGAEKLRVVSQLAASVSHEVRNPLTVTKGFLQLLRSENIEYEKQKEYLALSLQELDRAEQTITNYLNFAKPSEKYKVEKLCIKKEIEYLIEVMTPYALMQGVEIVISTLKDGRFVFGDKHRLRQCLINIAKNGIEAMPNGGELTISTRIGIEENIISIKDNGGGMPQEDLERLGTPLLKEARRGFGTMVAYKIIKEMGGKVIVESKCGVGTEFSLVFPNAK